MNKLTRKGWGRIYVDTPEDIQKVKDIIREMDEFEYDYLPDDLITTFDQYPAVAYTHKFCDMDMDALIATCWSRGIKIFVFDSSLMEYPSNQIKPIA